MSTPRDEGSEERRSDLPPAPPLPSAPPMKGSADSTARPKPVNVSFILWTVLAGLSLLSAITIFAFSGEAFDSIARESLRSSGQPFDESDVSQWAGTLKTVSGVIPLLFGVLYLTFAVKLRAGRNWARIAATVLGGIQVLLVALSSAGGGLNAVVNLAQAALVLAAIYLMYRPEANAYFAAARQRSY